MPQSPERNHPTRLTCTNTILFVQVSRQSRPIWTLFSRRRHSPQAESRAAASADVDEAGFVGGDAQPSRLPTEGDTGARGTGVAGGVGQGLGHDPDSGLSRRSRESVGHRGGLGDVRVCADSIDVEIDGDAGAAGLADRLPKALGKVADESGFGKRYVTQSSRRTVATAPGAGDVCSSRRTVSMRRSASVASREAVLTSSSAAHSPSGWSRGAGPRRSAR